MKLIMHNGYPYPYEIDLSDGVSESISEDCCHHQIVLSGVVHLQILHTVTIEFKDEESHRKAKELTGWKDWGDKWVLEAPRADGYIGIGLVAKVPYRHETQDGQVIESEWTEYAGTILVEE